MTVEAFKEAVQGNDVQVIRALLRDDADLPKQQIFGVPAFALAVNASQEVFDLVVEHSNYDQSTLGAALVFAAEWVQPERLRRLLEIGAPVDFEGLKAYRAIDWAASFSKIRKNPELEPRYRDMVSQLLQAGATLATPHTHRDPINAAATHAPVEVFEALVAHAQTLPENVLVHAFKASSERLRRFDLVLAKREQAPTTTEMVSTAGERHDDSVALMQRLIDAGGTVNAKTPEGWTPLHHAVFHCNLPMISFLLQAGADPKAKLSKGFMTHSGTQPKGTTPLNIYDEGDEHRLIADFLAQASTAADSASAAKGPFGPRAFSEVKATLAGFDRDADVIESSVGYRKLPGYAYESLDDGGSGPTNSVYFVGEASPAWADAVACIAEGALETLLGMVAGSAVGTWNANGSASVLLHRDNGGYFLARLELLQEQDEFYSDPVNLWLAAWRLSDGIALAVWDQREPEKIAALMGIPSIPTTDAADWTRQSCWYGE